METTKRLAPLQKIVSQGGPRLDAARLSTRAGTFSASFRYVCTLRLACGHRLTVPFNGRQRQRVRCRACLAAKEQP